MKAKRKYFYLKKSYGIFLSFIWQKLFFFFCNKTQNKPKRCLSNTLLNKQKKTFCENIASQTKA
jgi:hypothetical protein